MTAWRLGMCAVSTTCRSKPFIAGKLYGGMEVSEVKRLKELERENDELKKVVAELTLDNRMLRDVNAKKW